MLYEGRSSDKILLYSLNYFYRKREQTLPTSLETSIVDKDEDRMREIESKPVTTVECVIQNSVPPIATMQGDEKHLVFNVSYCVGKSKFDNGIEYELDKEILRNKLV